MTVWEEKQIKEYAEMYARNLVLYGVDVRDKLESATSISLALGQEYTKGRSDECERFKSAMAELQTYRSLGTVEELKEALEKQIPKKPIVDEEMKAIEVHYWNCPSCKTRYGTGTDMIELQHCHVCGQAIDWEEGAE